MASNQRTYVRLHEVTGDDDGVAFYASRYHFDLPAGSHTQVLEDLAAGRRRPEEYGADLGPQTPLDVGEPETEGLCVYAFWLNAIVDRQHRLRFVDPPFTLLPTLSSTNENYWRGMTLYPDSDRRWASLAFDAGMVRSSSLAGRMKSEARAMGAPEHVDAMTLPFCFNVIDPVLEAAPWMVPHPLKPKIHGGVHPQAVTSVGVRLD
jgi:hypothetical protein